MKVLQITHDLQIGGLQRVVTDLSTQLQRAGVVAEVLCLRAGGPFQAELDRAGIRVRMVNRPSGPGKYLSFLQVASIIRDSGAQVIHTHNTEPFIDGTLGGLLAGVPVKVHTDHARRYPDKKRYLYAERVLSRFVDQVVAVSEHTRNDLLQHSRIARKKIVVIPNGVDGAKYEVDVDVGNKRRELGIEGAFPVLAVGVRLTRQKGVEHLVQAMAPLHKAFPELRLLIAGDGPLRGELEQLAEATGVSNAVAFLGPRDDIHEILKVVDIYVLPSIWEGMPLVILEAMAAGKAIVASAVGGNTEVIAHNVNGILVEAGSPAALAEAIGALAGDRRSMLRLGEAARERFRARYSVERMADAYLSLYRSVLRARTRACRPAGAGA
ncbi:MAG: glycosyltransferase family 4 protein [bacterium]